MIYNALHYCTQELNRFLMGRFSTQEDKAILGSIVNESGAVPTENRNKIILTLVNLEHENNRPYVGTQQDFGNHALQQNLPLNFNLDILVSALFSNYDEALKFLSETIYFFQAKQVFTHENSPGLDPAIQKLAFEVIKMDYTEMHNLWASLGAKYLPSVVFKVRMLSFQISNMAKAQVTISKVDKNVRPA